MAKWFGTARRPDGAKRAVVLGGGGSKGSYQIGVWRALRELSIDYSVVTGTSVGALNGALMAQGCYDEACAMWRDLSNSQVMSAIPDVEDGRSSQLYMAYIREIVAHGGIDTSPLERHVRAIVDEDAIRASRIQLGMVTVDMDTHTPAALLLEEIPRGMVADYMVASSSFYPALRPKSIGSARFVDGGYYDNIPVELALRADPALDEILVVDVQGFGLRRKAVTTVPIYNMRCYWNLGSLLIFDNALMRRNMELGYLDFMRLSGRFEGRIYTFFPGWLQTLRERHLEAFRRDMDAVAAASPPFTGIRLNAIIQSGIAGHTPRQLRGVTPELALSTAAEAAGELLGLDPVQVYSADAFDLLLQQSFDSLALTSRLPSSAGDFKKLLPAENQSGIQHPGRGLFLLAAADSVSAFFAGGKPVLSPELLALLAPREFLAAMYLRLIA